MKVSTSFSRMHPKMPLLSWRQNDKPFGESMSSHSRTCRLQDGTPWQHEMVCLEAGILLPLISTGLGFTSRFTFQRLSRLRQVCSLVCALILSSNLILKSNARFWHEFIFISGKIFPEFRGSFSLSLAFE